mgnify:FL=1
MTARSWHPHAVNAWRLVRPTDVLLFVVLAGLVGVVGTVIFRRQLFASRAVAVRAEVGSLAPYVYYAFERSSVRMGAASVQTLCRSAQPVPREVAEIRGKSYAHRPEDWTPPGTDERDEGRQFLVGFRCLDYAGPGHNGPAVSRDPGGRERTAPPSKLLYFQMNYTSDSSPTSPGTAFEASARGDLDGDGDLSRIATTGKVRDGRLLIQPSLEVENPEE